MESPSLVLLAEGLEHWSTSGALIGPRRVTGAKIQDARIAALCLAYGVRALWTADRDFSRFPALQVVNPLTSEAE